MSVEELVALHDRGRRVTRRVSSEPVVLEAHGYSKAALAWFREAKVRPTSPRDRTLAEALRIALSDQVEAGLAINVGAGQVYERRMTRGEFEALAAPLVERTIEACKRAMRDAKRAMAGKRWPWRRISNPTWL